LTNTRLVSHIPNSTFITVQVSTCLLHLRHDNVYYAVTEVLLAGSIPKEQIMTCVPNRRQTGTSSFLWQEMMRTEECPRTYPERAGYLFIRINGIKRARSEVPELTPRLGESVTILTALVTAG
jgi:hypothetical protein